MSKLTQAERAFLEHVAETPTSPAGVALALDRDLGTVLDIATALQRRGLLERQGFDTCQMTDRGRAALATAP
ncbi:MAG: hypothetical protein ABEI77_07680 [Halorientalis sp.]